MYLFNVSTGARILESPEALGEASDLKEIGAGETDKVLNITPLICLGGGMAIRAKSGDGTQHANTRLRPL